MKALLIALIALFVGVVSSAQAQTPITLRPMPEVRLSAIRLSDVFDGISKDKDLDIAIAPAPGKSVTYNLHVLTALSEQYNLGWKPRSVADKSVLTRAATWITPDMIRQVVESKVQSVETRKGDRMEIVFDSKTVGVALPIEDQPVFDLNGFLYDPQTHRFRSELVARSSSGPVVQTVTGRVMISRDVPVLARRLASGTVIGESDLVWQSIPQERLTGEVLTDASQIIGLELRHGQAEDALLRARDLIPPRLVKRGSLVTMMVATPSLRITTQGRALQDGALGDIVRITNVQSHRIVEGTVQANGTVRIGAPQKLALAE